MTIEQQRPATKIVTGRNLDHRIDNLFATRELVERALTEAGCDDVQAAWSNSLAVAMEHLGPWMISLAIRTAGLGRRSRRVRSDNRSGHAGIQMIRGRWRGRCWKDGKVIWELSSSDLDRVVQARAAFLADQINGGVGRG